MTLRDFDPKTSSIEEIVTWAIRPIKAFADMVQRDYESDCPIDEQDTETQSAYYMLLAIEDMAQQIEDFIYAKMKSEREGRADNV